MLRLFTKSRFTFAAALLSLVAANQVLAQGKTLTRRYEPIVVTAGKLSALKDDTIKVFTAYCYVNDEFRPSPFQIDEVTNKGEYLIEKDAVADFNDEIVFMPQGTGHQAPTDKWVVDSDDVRLELEVTDPITQEKGWLYLFQHVKNPAVAPSHVRYGPAPPNAAGADTVTGESYIEAHEKDTGWFTDISIKAPFGDGKDIFDRQKVRFKVKLSIFAPITVKEDTLQFVNARFEQRPVRSFREISYNLDVFGTKYPFAFNAQYFPYSTSLDAKNVTLPPVSGLTYIEVRLSADFNELAKGMMFFNAYNPGILVDGVQDSYNKTITDPPDGLNWFMLTGNSGTYLTLIDVPRLGTKRELYYKDNLATDINDSGDKKSYGDSGLLISSPPANVPLSINFTTYYLDKNQAATFGDGFKQRALKPLQVIAVEQKRTITAVNEDHPLPTGFALHDAQPNPFAPQLGQVRISFGLGATNLTPSLRIFNLLGQEVARFAGVDLRRSNTVLWDGRDQLGRAVPAGVYFYQLEAGRQRAVKKLMLVR